MTKVLKQVTNERNGKVGSSGDAPLRIVPVHEPGGVMIPTGIDALDRRLGGLEPGGVYLVAGTPGPAKLVSALQFLHAGLSRGERGLLLTGIEAAGLLDLARAWGSRLDRAWEHGDLEIVGFRDDFELRVLRSTEPEEALDELARLAPEDVVRIAVDPGSMFLQSGSRSILGRTFLDWARRHPATVWITLSVDDGESLPSSAEWLLHATDGVFMLDRLSGGLYQILIQRSLPDADDGEDPATLKLIPGVGLTEPEEAPARRSTDRPVGDPDQVLMVSLGDALSPDIQTWAERRFSTEIVTDPLEAVTRLQGGYKPGCVLVLSSRTQLKAALQTCRALRPLTGAAIVFASDDSIRSTDRVNLLDAGADDSLSGGIDVRELETRIEQSAAVGGKPPSSVRLVAEGGTDLQGGVKDPDTFRQEVEHRKSDPTHSLFSIVTLASPRHPPSKLERLLAEIVRDEEGDLVTRTSHGCLVLLQGARRESAKAFNARFKTTYEDQLGPDPELQVQMAAHPSQQDQVERALALLGASAAGDSTNRDMGGSGGQEA